MIKEEAIKVSYLPKHGLFDIKSESFNYSLIENMSKSGHGEGLQPGWNISEDETRKLCLKCAMVHSSLSSLVKAIEEIESRQKTQGDNYERD